MEILSKKARYALHGVGFIAKHGKMEPVAFDQVLAYLEIYSGRLALSPGYLAKIFQTLSKAALVHAVSGPRGGYRLARDPANIRLIEIIEALDGPVLTGCCLLSIQQCPVQTHCAIGDLLRGAERSFYDFFQKRTVATLVSKMAFPDLDAPRPASRGRRRERASSTTS